MAGRVSDAIQLFSEVLDELLGQPARTESTFLKARRAAHLASQHDLVKWLNLEIDGYSETDSLPTYRSDIYGISRQGPRVSSVDDRKVLVPVHDDLNQILTTTQTGKWIEIASEFRSSFSHRGISVSAAQFQRLVSRLRSVAYDRISKIYAALTYGNAVGSVWAGFQSIVDDSIPKLGIENHLLSIADDLNSTNPVDWTGALYKCRDLLRAVSDSLWRIDAVEYPPLSEPGKPFQVQKDKYMNRLAAYLHAKSTRDSASVYLRSEWERLASLMYRLNELNNRAHAPLDNPGDAHLAVVSTYLALHELVRMTDLDPITEMPQF